jgi:hypothetical protein
VERMFEVSQGWLQRLLVQCQEYMSDVWPCRKEGGQKVTPQTMRKRIASLAVAILLTACGGGTASQTPTADAGIVHCSSSSDGPVVGPIAADAGTDPGCQRGGRCLFVGASPGSGTCALYDGGCTTDPGAPSWACVYAAGITGSSGGSSSP